MAIFNTFLPLLLLWAGFSNGAEQEPLGLPKTKKQPNIVFILTDDQDLHMDSLSYMPHLKKYIADQGTTFQNHYCTVALCCPSRVSLWTGKAAHNTNVTDVNPPHGGYPKFISQGLNDAYLPLWLQEVGYGTYYVGKLFNAQTVDNYASPPAAGWTGSEFLLDPYTYEYLNTTFSRNGGKPQSYPNQYSTDLIRDKSFAFLDDAMTIQQETSQPFFLTIAPTAPHTNVHINSNVIDNFTEHSNIQLPPVPAERHKHLFPGVKVPRTEHFNPQDPHSVSWISRLPHQNSSNLEYNDNFYRKRLQSLQSVDEIIPELIERLEKSGILNETYIIYSTDNGYHIGQHRLQPGKQCAFEEDINIPFLIRGSGIPQNHTTDLVTSHTDLAPTFLSLVGAQKMREDFDGQAIPLLDLLEAERKEERNEHVNVEMWGIIMSEGKFGSVLYPNHTYKAVRVVGKGYSFLYMVWCGGEHELYDLVHDPYQIDNLYSSNHSTTFITFESEENFTGTSTTHLREKKKKKKREEIDSPPYHASFPQFLDTPPPPHLGHSSSITHPDPQAQEEKYPLTTLLSRLDALLLVLKNCKGRECTHPWESLHPPNTNTNNEDELKVPRNREGDVVVRNLRDAMRKEFDGVYEGIGEKIGRVGFERCEKGFILESEGVVWDGGRFRVWGYLFDEGG
ncbi:related to ARS-1 arylsulfatase [Ramularia collo-cygni]|uniref:Related to ARS-1 arylsulfatase n=1 Tax=Ramularia collo-cygni TaxID=112498 RepID=A0A2D3VNS0_9PEZI|nr:related to ARS-1 arylsulfatase [Ramularia collo-cygni]CZT23448.1 related to ARS-1 arylsulfatase [Ramularia collo-cygni]